MILTLFYDGEDATSKKDSLILSRKKTFKHVKDDHSRRCLEVVVVVVVVVIIVVVIVSTIGVVVEVAHDAGSTITGGAVVLGIFDHVADVSCH